MPAPARTSLEEIVDTGRTLLERAGLKGLTMKKVADEVGVKAPSLYKHVADRGDLIRLIVEEVASDLGETLESVVSGSDPRNDVVRVVDAFRDFARDQPEAYRLLFASVPDQLRPDPKVFHLASESVVRTMESLVGEDSALLAARLVTAWAHGFVSMELAGAFRMGGSIDDAFAYGIERIVDSL